LLQEDDAMSEQAINKEKLLPEDRAFYTQLGACTALSLAIVLIAELAVAL
jgi:hypothetical protein